MLTATGSSSQVVTAINSPFYTMSPVLALYCLPLRISEALHKIASLDWAKPKFCHHPQTIFSPANNDRTRIYSYIYGNYLLQCSLKKKGSPTNSRGLTSIWTAIILQEMSIPNPHVHKVWSSQNIFKAREYKTFFVENDALHKTEVSLGQGSCHIVVLDLWDNCKSKKGLWQN